LIFDSAVCCPATAGIGVQRTAIVARRASINSLLEACAAESRKIPERAALAADVAQIGANCYQLLTDSF
jgi:hypothetical protein